MASLIAPTTELEAVNACLMNIGESPVSSITGQISVDASTALAMVRNTTREIQTHGFYWNSELNYKLIPNHENKLQLPTNTLKVDTTGDDITKDLVARGRYLYDRVNHTYTFTDPVIVELIVALNFEEMPEAARRYVTVRSSRIYQERVMATPTLSSFNTVDEDFARAQLLAENISVEDNNMLTDSLSTFGILARLNY
jgi:hypothetical protein